MHSAKYLNLTNASQPHQILTNKLGMKRNFIVMRTQTSFNFENALVKL